MANNSPDASPRLLVGLMLAILLLICAVSFVLYQTIYRPLPEFRAMQADGQKMLLSPSGEPNQLPDTILRWASKAAVLSYTFDFVNYRKQIAAVRPYYTDAGWGDYLSSVRNLINTIVKSQLFINGVVAGTPVVSNQGELPNRGYVWRVQIPFLVTYQAAQTLVKRHFVIAITLVRVPTSVNPQGIGIDQFVMV